MSLQFQQSMFSPVRKGITPSDVHVNTPMTNLSVAQMASADMFIADRIFPRIPVQKQSDIYYVYPPGSWNTNEMAKRAPATETKGGTYDVSTQPYYCHVYGVHRDVDDQLRANADGPINVDRDATNWVTRKGLIFREVEFANQFFRTGVWASEKTGVAATPGANQFLRWNDAAAEPVKDVKRWIGEFLLRTGFRPNTMVVGYDAYQTLTESDAIIDRIKYTSSATAPSIVTRQALAALFEVDRIEVLSAIQNTAAAGLAPANAFIGDTDGILLCYVAPQPGLLTPSAGYSFVWSGYSGAGEFGTRIKQFRMEKNAADRFELEMAFSMEQVSADMGTYINSVNG